MLLVHIGWIFIARGGTNPVTGSTPWVTGKIISSSTRKNISYDEAKWKVNPVTWNLLYVAHIHHVIRGTFPVTWNIPMSQEKLPVTGKIPLVTKGV